MKKTYINPELEVVKLQTMQMLASSLILDDVTEVTDEVEVLAPELDEEFDFGEDEFEEFE